MSYRECSCSQKRSLHEGDRFGVSLWKHHEKQACCQCKVNSAKKSDGVRGLLLKSLLSVVRSNPSAKRHSVGPAAVGPSAELRATAQALKVRIDGPGLLLPV